MYRVERYIDKYTITSGSNEESSYFVNYFYQSATLCTKRANCNTLLQRVTEKQKTVQLTDRMWARLLASTNQPSFVSPDDLTQERVDNDTVKEINV